MRSRKLSLPMLCLFAAMVGSFANTGYGYEWSWSNVSDNGQYVFVYLVPDPVHDQIQRINEDEEDPPYFTRASEIAEVQRLHNAYTTTGVYRNNGSTTPLWTTSGKYDVGKPTDDGSRLVSFDNHHIFEVWVVEQGKPKRNMQDIEMIGWPALILYVASGKYAPYAENYVVDPTSQHVLVTWDNNTTTTIRLDDFAVVQSNVLPHAFFQLFTTMQGIGVFLVFVLITCGVSYAIARCFMGGGKEARR